MKQFYLPILVIGIFLSGCKNEKESANPLTVNTLNGYVQKGPFVVGTQIMVSELNDNLNQTGKTFTATIKDDQGSFSLQNVILSSKYIDLRANGFYFNEVSGKLSASQISLSTLSDITNAASVNVNLLTHLEKGRVEYLMSTEKKPFASAKKQAQKEILAIFNIAKSDMANSEQLNIALSGEDNAILLAISAILQAQRTESELTELLSKFSLDIEKDGTLDDKNLQSAILNEAYLLDQESVRNNIIKRYSELGIAVSPAGFEKYITSFIQESSFSFTKAIEYPATTSTGINLLSTTDSVIAIAKSPHYHWYYSPIYQNQFSVSAIAPIGTTVRIKIITPVLPDSSHVGLHYESLGNWQQGATLNNNSIEIIHKGTGEKSEAIFAATLVKKYGRKRIEIYENNATQPTQVREITFVGDSSALPAEMIEYPQDMATSNGVNILDAHNRTSCYGQVSMVALVPSTNKVKVRITINAKLETTYANGNWKLVNHQVTNGLDVYEFENTYSVVKAHSNFKSIQDDRTPYMGSPRARFEVFENNSKIPTKIKEFDWYQ